MSRYWIVYLKPFGKDAAEDDIRTFQRQCIKNKIFGMGWHIPFDMLGCTELDDYKSFDNMWKKYTNNPGEKVSEQAYKNFHKIKAGDRVIIRNLNARYYVGRVSSAAQYDKNDDSRFSWFCTVDEWIDIEEKFGDVPSVIVGRFSQRSHPTISGINTEMIQKVIDLLLDERTAEKPEVNSSDFNIILNADELEDIVGLYMQNENPEFFFLPSSCKRNTQKYEFTLINSESQKITCQVKNMREINIDEYIEDSQYLKIYLFSGLWDDESIGGLSPSGNIRIISKAELYEFLKGEKCLFYRRILEKWYTLK